MKNFLFTLLITAGFNTFAQTPQLVGDVVAGAGGCNPITLSEYNGKLYFCGTEAATGMEIYVYDGINPPSLLYNINPGNASSQSLLLYGNRAVYNNKMYFYGNNGTNGGEIMSYDGVNSPIVAVDVVPGATGSGPRQFLAYDGKLYFSAFKATTGSEFYVYDGTNAPVMFEINPGVG